MAAAALWLTQAPRPAKAPSIVEHPPPFETPVPLPVPPRVMPVPAEPPPVPRRRLVTTPPRPTPPPKDPGLTPAPHAGFRIVGDRAVLGHGRIGYRHDAKHDPGVSAVALVDLPVTFAPVGTRFVVEARSGVAMVVVQEGQVEIRHDDGKVLERLSAPAEALVFDAPGGSRVQVALANGQPPDTLLAEIPEGCRCERSDVVATIARLRLATR